MTEVDTVVVGGGTAGLAAAWHLRAAGKRFVVLERDDRPGDVWRRRYDSLRLFTPARFCRLPGLPFPLDPRAHPSGTEMADYLSEYAEHFAMPLHTGVRVRSHTVAGGQHRITADNGTVFEADSVIAATGAFGVPMIPAFAGDLSPGPPQMHSADYRNPANVPPGPVLIVGAGTSAGDIAVELAREHEVWMAGPSTGSVPVALSRSRVLQRLVFSRRVPSGALGGLVRAKVRRAAPLVWQSPASLRAAGVHRVPRVAGTRDGRPRLADGRVLDVASVVWCTGYRPGFGWLTPRAFGPDGWPAHRRGISATVPGLGFVGLPFQNTFSSGLVSGIPTDAAVVVNRLARHRSR
ncbi:flavin-containing monooxygenase [Actinoplanes sp. NPDC048988]|uniref:flavin-containing monooxygenase n=1 Tax=Actinoplanes sp. NPDC048988 TaxID=3363901 RepID=UPI0037119B6D